MGKKLVTEKEEKEIIAAYINGSTIKELAIKYNYSSGNHHSLLNIIKKYNITVRPDNYTRSTKYTINANFFKEINTIEKAYFLGFLCADGSISKDRNEIKITISEDDKELLELFSKSIETNKPLRYVKNNSIYNRKPQYTMALENQKIKQDILNLGIAVNKTENFSIPFDKIPEKLQSHFIRGFFDGDGCITQSKKGNHITAHVSFSGTKELTEQLREYFFKKIETNPNIKIQKRFKDRDTNSGYTLSYGGNIICRKFYDFLYKDCGEFHLKRKKLKFEQNLKISSL